MKKMKIEIPPQSISQLFKNTIMEIDSLKDFFDTSINSIQNSENDLKKKYKCGLILADAFDSVFKENDFETQKKRVEEIKNAPIKDHILIKDVVDLTISENEANKLSFTILDHNAYNLYNPNVARRKEAMITTQKKLLSQSVLSSIVTIFESYLSRIYEILVITDPKSYLNDKQIHITQIFNVSISEIIHDTVQDEVEQKMFDSLKALDLIKEKSKFDIDRYCKIRNYFEEIYYRRNIFIHNNGIVNERYLSKVDKDLCNELKKGQYAECNKEYLNNSIRTLKKVISTMYFELLNTIPCNDIELYYTLSNVGFDALCEEEYDIAEHIYNLLRNHTEFEFIDKATYQVNYINSLKQQGKDYLKLLKKFDVSIATDNFKIAKLCLEDKFEEAYNLLVQSYPKSFNAIEIREWPLFIDFRKTEFYEKFKESHITDFNEFIFEDRSLLLEPTISNDKCETTNETENDLLPIA